MGLLTLFLSLCLFASGTTFCRTTSGDLFLDGVPSSSIVRGPHISCVTQSSVIITWTTRTDVRSTIRYGLSSNYESVIKEQNPLTVHEIVLTGLNANRQYHYRIFSESDSTPDYGFWSAVDEKSSFVFAAYGDTRSNQQAHVGVLRQIEKNKPRFLLQTGDLVARNTVANWDKYFEDLCDSTTVGETIPVFSCPGNHDSGQMYYDVLMLPHNNPQQTMEYYSFDYGSVHFISVNSEIDYKIESPQYRWLVQDLESPTRKAATFTIAFWHRPPYSSSNHGSDMSVREVLGTLMESYGVDLVFNGHDHCYERTKPINGVTYVVTGGGGAPLYDFKENANWTAYKEKAYHFCVVAIEGKVLRMSMTRDDGSVQDSFVIDKGKQ